MCSRRSWVSVFVVRIIGGFLASSLLSCYILIYVLIWSGLVNVILNIFLLPFHSVQAMNGLHRPSSYIVVDLMSDGNTWSNNSIVQPPLACEASPSASYSSLQPHHLLLLFSLNSSLLFLWIFFYLCNFF
jgi:hypothetical protein